MNARSMPASRILRWPPSFWLLNILAVAHPTAWTSAQDTSASEPTVQFVRDIQPILATHCWSCHGVDESARKASLRLDAKDAALTSGALVPGDPDASALVERITSHDDDLMMPPPSTKKPLSPAQIELLKTWIAEGANFAGHWAFEQPRKTTPPTWDGMPENLSPIDRYIRHRLRELGLTNAEPADRNTLLRRVTLDLTGLPPTQRELVDFLEDTAPDAFEKVVDRLLASDAYAERMAAVWLDLARYADTNGYNNDEDRTMWPWRDWVIQAFANNMPFDQFLTEQLAGDLLPQPTRAQRIATGFLRNQGHNTEGGIIEEEYRVEYVADRVHTTATVFLGLSMQCARCHDHKYDPIRQDEYYQFFSLFNNLDEKQASYSKFIGAPPFVRVPSPEQEKRQHALEERIQTLEKELAQRQAGVENVWREWLAQRDDAHVTRELGNERTTHFPCDALEELEKGGATSSGVQVAEGKVGTAFQFEANTRLTAGEIGDIDADHPFAISVWVYPQREETMAVLSKIDESDNYRGYDVLLEGGKVTVHLIHRWPENALKVSAQTALASNQWNHVVVVSDGSQKANGIRIAVNGEFAPSQVHQDNLTASVRTTKPFRIGLRETTLPWIGKVDELQLFRGALTPDDVRALSRGEQPTPLSAWVRSAWTELSEEQRAQIGSWVKNRIDPEYGRIQDAMASANKDLETLKDGYPAVMVMEEMATPRETFVLKRGQYDQPGARVDANVPIALRGNKDGVIKNRLELAKWLVDSKHPLTARVAVNRYWELLFGAGIVRTVEDFGVTGEYPSHPELLDHLAVSYVQDGWDTKALIKAIVMSRTYQQSSVASDLQRERDPENRWLSRGPRYRLSAEMIRDGALAISGLLQTRVGGPSVKPYQPEGLWEDVTVERRGKYVADVGEGLYRRSLYTFWKRTCPPPSMVNFDAPNREVCVARRSRTNTPLQALALLNDPTYVEASRAFAEALLADPSMSDTQRVHMAMLRCVAREPRAEEVEILCDLLRDARSHFGEKPEAAMEFNRIGTREIKTNASTVELAAWTMIASTLLNLDETISKR